jgi:hypothetical protein
MSLTHPVFPPENNATTNLPTAFANLNAALRALDGADTLVIDAGATALNTVLPRIPQVLAVHGAPGSLDGNGRYVLRLPNSGSPDQMLIVANRTAAPLRLETADGTNALVGSLAPGRIEAFVLSGSTIGAYALSSTRTGKAATAHTHTLSDIADVSKIGKFCWARRNASQTLTAVLPNPVAYQINEFVSNTLNASIDGNFGIVVPETGLYRVIAMIDGFSSGIGVRVQVSVNLSSTPVYSFPPRTVISSFTTPPIELAANDSVRLMLSLASTGSQEIGNASSFVVERIR